MSEYRPGTKPEFHGLRGSKIVTFKMIKDMDSTLFRKERQSCTPIVKYKGSLPSNMLLNKHKLSVQFQDYDMISRK